MSTPTISVIIPVFNDSDRLRHCLELVIAQTITADEIIVINNDSTEDIASICADFPMVKYLYESKRGSYAARNTGIRHATGEIVAFTDSDCQPSRTWLEMGVRTLLEHRTALVAGHVQFTFQRERPTEIEYADALSHLRQRDYAQSGFAATANMITFREYFEQLGLFREDLLSLGDQEWGKRLSATGLSVVYAPDAIVFHPARTSMRSLLKKVRLQATYQHRLRPFRWRQLVRQVLPLGFQFWRSVQQDSILQKGEKLRFAWAIHRVKWAIAGVMVRSLIICS